MKIAIFGYGNPAEAGGIPTFIRNLATTNQQLDYFYYGKSEALVHDIPCNLKVTRPSQSSNFTIELLTFAFSIKSLVAQYDTLVFNIPFLLLGLTRKELTGNKVLLVQHNTKEFVLNEPFKKKNDWK